MAQDADTATADTADSDNGDNFQSKKALVDRIVAVIEQASAKGVSKHKIVKFLKNQQEITQSDINHGYQRYYEKHHLYEITFSKDKMGFSVIMDPHGKNAIVSSIQDITNEKVGLKIASRIVEIHGTNVEGWQHRKILDKIQQQKTRPFFIVFREPPEDLNLSKLKKKEQNIHKFLTEKEIDELQEGDSSFNSDEDDDSSFDSEDKAEDTDNKEKDKDKEEKKPDRSDVKAVMDHTQRKLNQRHKHLVTVATMKDIQWEEDEVAEMEARLREMMEAQNMATIDENTTKALTHKRRETLMSLLDAQGDEPSQSSQNGSSLMTSQSAYPLRMAQNRSNSSLSVSSGMMGGHYSQYSNDSTHRMSIMNQLATEHPDWTVEQIRNMASTLQEQQRQNSQVLFEQTKGATSTAAFIQGVGVGGNSGGGNPQQRMANGMMKPVTPSTRAMQVMWTQPQQPMHHPSYSQQSMLSVEQKMDHNVNVASPDLLGLMKKGCVMHKRTTKGKLVPRWVEFSPDFTKLRWYSPRKGKNLKTTSVNLARIQKIHVGKQSSVTLTDKSTAFTLEYLDKSDQVGTLTLVAESQQQAFLWFQAIKMCGDASKRGNPMMTEIANEKLAKLVAEKNPNVNRGVVLDLPGSNNKLPTISDLEKLLKRANDLYKKVLPLIQGKKGIVLKSLKKRYKVPPRGAFDPAEKEKLKQEIAAEQVKEEKEKLQDDLRQAVEYEDVSNSIENVKKAMLEKYAKNLSDYKFLLDRLTVEDDDNDMNGNRGQQLTELKISLFLMINELVGLKVKLVAIARRFQSSDI